MIRVNLKWLALFTIGKVMMLSDILNEEDISKSELLLLYQELYALCDKTLDKEKTRIEITQKYDLKKSVIRTIIICLTVIIVTLIICFMPEPKNQTITQNQTVQGDVSCGKQN